MQPSFTIRRLSKADDPGGIRVQQNNVSAAALEKLLPVLMHIQANLEGDLSLRTISQRLGLSPFHFHRVFRLAIGETLKQYTRRLRLERAANGLIIHEGSILDIALDSGFQSHETFSREFKRQFQVTPRQYREWGRGNLKRNLAAAKPVDQIAGNFELSQTRVTRLSQLDVAFIRHTGPYEAVSDTLWLTLSDWARRKRFPADPVFLGIAHDAPGITPPEKLRFDAAIVVPEPFSPHGAIGHQVLGSADFAVTTHVGHFRTLPDAYRTIVHRIGALKGYRLGGLPSIEIYRTTRVDADHEMNQTDIYLPVVAGRRSSRTGGQER
jgi:AraC family transcriptional regulator